MGALLQGRGYVLRIAEHLIPSLLLAPRSSEGEELTHALTHAHLQYRYID
jgi:hypothetical protein